MFALIRKPILLIKIWQWKSVCFYVLSQNFVKASSSLFLGQINEKHVEIGNGLCVKASETHCCKNKLICLNWSLGLVGHIHWCDLPFEQFNGLAYMFECMSEGKLFQTFALNMSSLLFCYWLSMVFGNLSFLVFRQLKKTSTWCRERFSRSITYTIQKKVNGTN